VTEKSEPTKVVRKIVVFIDICSSTTILEELLKTENEKCWRNLLIGFKKYLLMKRSSDGFELYKFLGDGWILLFDPQPEGLKIFQLLENLSDKFFSLYKRRIRKVLTIQISTVGLTFGMDISKSIKIVMDRKTEYVGRSLNIAARLQGSVGEEDEKPQNKGLVSKNLFATFTDKRKIRRNYTVYTVVRQLKNISSGKDYRCLKVELK
jgi:hypothetical protein